MDYAETYALVRAMSAEIADDDEFSGKVAALVEREIGELTVNDERRAEYKRFVATPEGARLRKLLLSPTSKSLEFYKAEKVKLAAR